MENTPNDPAGSSESKNDNLPAETPSTSTSSTPPTSSSPPTSSTPSAPTTSSSSSTTEPSTSNVPELKMKRLKIVVNKAALENAPASPPPASNDPGVFRMPEIPRARQVSDSLLLPMAPPPAPKMPRPKLKSRRPGPRCARPGPRCSRPGPWAYRPGLWRPQLETVVSPRKEQNEPEKSDMSSDEMHEDTPPNDQ